MESMISAIVTIGELLNREICEIGYLRSSKSRNREVYKLPQDRVLNIPKYQREIRWSTNNIQVLVDDIKEEPKFLGNVLMSTDDDYSYNIIDGQQRLTSILMLLKAINCRHKKEKIQICSFNNESFPDIKEAIDNDFYVASESKRKTCILADTLNQCETLERLWAYSKRLISELDEEEFSKVEEHLLESDINLLIQPIRDKKDQKRVCVDYFIDINNKNVRLDYIDILKAYAFKEDFETTIDKWIAIQEKSKENVDLFYYPMESLYLHYILCTVNQKLSYGVKALSDQLKLRKPTKINGTVYEAGTDIELLITDEQYYTHMLDIISTLLEFLSIIPNDKSSYGADFERYITPSDGALNDEFKQNMFVIINGIIRSSDVVPKLLLMKYFVEVIKNDNATCDDYKLIYPIGILATFFSAGKGDLKNRNEFSNLVLSKNWKVNLDKKAKTRIANSLTNVMYDKEIKYKGTYTQWSGQYLARRLHAVLHSVSYGSKIKYNPDIFKSFNASPDYNDEHFIINQSYSVDFTYKKQARKYIYPENIKPLVSHLGNYLFILKGVNTKLGNKTIKDKITIIEEYLTQGKPVFQDKLSQIQYEAARSVFKSGSCPTEMELKKCVTYEEAEEKLNSYYTDKFIEEYNSYVVCLKNEMALLDIETSPLKYKKD